MRRFLALVTAFGIVAFVTPAVGAGVVLATLIYLPLPATIPEPIPGLERNITHVVDAQGNEIATFKEFETSIPVRPEDIPQVLKDAVVASEDRRFYTHGGFDLRGTLRALWTDIRAGEAVEGGSTITQQYVRQAFEEVGTEDTVSRKIREAILASQVERELDKDEILYRYLSTVYFGEGAYGIGAAARTYFRKSPRDLTLSEAALLVGTLPAPTLYSPRDHPMDAELRRREVLDDMLREGMITPEQHAAATVEGVWFAWNGPPPGPATIVQPPETQQSTQPWFTDYVRVWIESSGALSDCVPGDCPILYRGGLRIETTMDPRAQAAAQAEVDRLLAGTPENLEAAIVAVEPPTGFVRAIVGGRDFNLSQVNTALRARQTGSTAKTFVLATAFEQGIQPTAVYSGAPYQLPNGDVIQNYGGARYGNLDLRSATTNSVNTAFVRLIEDVTVAATFDLSTRLGISMPAVDPERSTPNVLVDAADPTRAYGLSVALGAIEVSPLQMAAAYAVFANHGRRAPATPVLRILDRDGNVLVDNTGAQEAAEQVIAPEVADNVTDVLRGVLTDGTAAGRALAGRPAAGKTGTAQDNANAWFVGYTPTLSTAVWMGYRDCGAGPQCTLRNVAGHRGAVTGGSLPARVWQRFMNAALEGVEVTEFTEPAPIPDVRDEVLRGQRGGFAPGRRRAPAEAPASEGFVEDEGTIWVEVPETTTTTIPTTTTTAPPSTVVFPPNRPPFTLFPDVP